MNEKFHFNESLVFDGKQLNLKPDHISGRLVGEVTTTGYDKMGRVMFKRKDTNDVVLPGAIFMLEQLFKTTASDRRLHPTSINLGPNIGSVSLTSAWSVPASINAEKVFGFMAGNGGASASGANAVSFNRSSLTDGNGNASFMPFRIINASVTQPTGYALPVLADGKYLYFAKLFDEDPTIVVSNDAAYAQMEISVTAEEFREYFTQAGVTTNTGINQIALVAGNYISSTATYDDVKIITTLNFTTLELEEGSHFELTYKLYCL